MLKMLKQKKLKKKNCEGNGGIASGAIPQVLHLI